MEFVIGEKYVCRDGSIAEYVGKTPRGDGKAACYSEVFMVNGDRNWWTEGGLFYANAGEHRLDIIKEQAMQLEAGKYYKTRDGRKAFVASVMLPNPFGRSTIYVIRGYDNSTSRACSWTSIGTEHDGRNGPNDLVSEWIDPPQEIVVDGVTYVRKAGV